MKFTEPSELATRYLKEAIPLMAKYRVSPNPINYALWYAYSAKTCPALNKSLEATVATYGTCPEKIAEELFVEHMAQPAENNGQDLSLVQAALQTMIVDLGSQAGNAAKVTQDYNVVLKESLKALDDDDATQPLESIIKTLAENTDAVYSSNEQFQRQISNAQSEIQKLKVELEANRHAASIDPLTGLFNRRYFDQKFAEFDNDNQCETLSLFMVDIDHFKQFNDTHGHLLGDQVLKYVAKLLQQECPSPLLAVRFGGEEFAVLCPALEQQQAAEQAEQLRQKLAKVCFTHKKSGQRIEPITASFGVAQQQPGESAEELLDRADTALYQAKKAGRNQVHCA